MPLQVSSSEGQRRRLCGHAGRGWSNATTSPGMPATPEAGMAEERSPPPASQEAVSRPHLDFSLVKPISDLSSPVWGGMCFGCVKPEQPQEMSPLSTEVQNVGGGICLVGTMGHQ